MSEIDDILKGAPEHKPGAGSNKAAAAAPVSEIDQALRDAPAPARGFGGWARDIAATAVKGAIAVPEAVVGLADIPTGGAVGKFLENEGGAVGFRPKQAKEAANEWHSDATKQAQQAFQEADGLGGKFKAAIENPSVIASAVGESLPSMAAGGVAARGLMAATRLGQMGAGGAALAGAAGEGLTMAGSAAEQIRQETPDGLLTPTQAGLAAATGAVGGALGAVGGKVAQRLGIGDVDTMVAQGAAGLTTGQAQQAALKSIPKQIIQGAISEGFLEELPQSVAEQVFQNLALGKDWTEGVDAAAVLGVLSGGAMGGGAAGFKGFMDRGRQPAQPEQKPSTPGMDRIRQEYEARLAALAQQEAGEPQVPQAAPPDGRAVLNAQEAAAKASRDAEMAANRAVESPDDEILQSTGANVPRSVQMGLNPANGPMSAAAATAVDTGVTDKLAADEAAKAQAEADADTAGVPVVDYADLSDEDRAMVDDFYRRMDEETRDFLSLGMEDDDIPDFDAPGDPGATEQFLRSMGASEQEIQDAISTTSAPAGPLQSAAGNGPAAQDGARRPQEGAGADEAAQGQSQGLTATPTATPGEPSNGTQAPQAVQAATQGPAQPAPAAQPAAWDGLSADQRAEVAARAGLPKILAANIPGAAWDQINPGTRAKLAAAIQATPDVQAAKPAATTTSPAVEPQAAGRAGVSGVDQPGAVPALSNVKDAPQQPAGTEAKAAPGEARAPEGGNAAAAGGVPAAGDGAGVRADGVSKKQVFNIGGRDPHTVTFEHKDDGRLIRTITYPDGQANTETLVTDRNGDESWVSQSAYEKGEFYPAQLSGAEASTAIRDDISGKAVEPAAPGAGDVQADGVKAAAIAEAAHQAATSPKNDLPQPTEAQKEAGNYQKGHARVAGHDITIENPAGSKRRPEWPALKNHYGYFKGSVGADKDHVDVFMTDRAGDESLPVFVVDQVNQDGTFDEHKVVMGAADEADARATYLQNYEKGWTGLGAITQMSQEDFKAWVRDPAKTKKPVALKRGVLAKMADQKRTAALDRIAKGTAYFGTKDKADEFITKSGISDTHEVVQAKAGRFEIRAKGEQAPNAAVSRVIVSRLGPDGLTDAERAAGKPSYAESEEDYWKNPKLNSWEHSGRADFKAGKPRTLPSYFTDSRNGNAKAWFRGWDRAKLDADVSQPKSEKQPEASAAAAPASTEKTVRVPAEVEAAMAGQMNKQKARIRRLNNEVSAPGMTLADKVEVQTKIKAADATLRKMRQTVFDAEDAAVKAVESRDIKAFAEHEMLFPDAYKAIQELLGQNDELDSEMQSYERKADEKPKGIVGRRADGVMIREDENGVRYYTDGGVRISETVTMRPTRQGVQVSRGELKPDFMTAEELAASKAQAAPAVPAPAKPDPLTEKEKAAKAKMLGAAAKLADLLSKSTRANITPEQEQKMLPIVIELFEGAMDLGYVKFKQAARYVREFIAGAIDQDAADSIPIDTLQGAYIATARRHADKDITPKKDVITVESIADLEEPAESADTGAPENDDATPDQPGPQALDAVPAEDDSGAARPGATGAGAASGSEAGKRPDSGTAPVRVPAARGGRGGTRRISDPQARADGEKRPRGRRAEPAGAGVPAGDAGPGVADLFGGNQTAETASTPNIPAQNFRIEADLNLGRGGEVAKFNDNMAAIRVVKAIEADRRRATPEEQRILARFVGWGGLASAFPNPETGKFKPDWEKRGNELRDLLTPSEYRAASRSTRNAHYTSEVVVSAMWDAVRRLGYRHGLALESSVGSGNFLGLKPADIGARFIGVEYDSITARLAGALYPQATVLHSGFQDVALPDNAFDLVIGNPPFGDESLRFQYKPELRGVSIHNQFFRASLDALRPGGLQAQVVSSFLMDAHDKSTRMELAKKARLVSAFRLPDTAFKENARTEVVTDIIILQRRSLEEQAEVEEVIKWIASPPSPKDLKEMGEEGRMRYGRLSSKYEKELAWVTTSDVADPLGGDPIRINSYFASNPGNIIGTLDRSGTMRTKGMMNVHLDDPSTLGDRLRDLVSKLPENIVDTAADIEAKTEQAYKLLGEAMRISVAREEPGHMTFDEDGKLARVIEREYGDGTVLQRQAIAPGVPWSSSLFMDSEGRWYSVDVKMDDKGNKVKIVKDGKPTKFNEYTKTVYQTEADIPASMRLSELDHERLVALVNMRDLLKRQLVLETEDAVKVMMEGNRTKLAEAYKAYVDKHGPINRRANAALVNEMPDGGLVLALESSYEPARSADQAKKSGLPKQDESATPAPILRERVVPKYEPPTTADSPADALAITLADRGMVDIEHIAKLLNTSPAEAEAALTDGEKPLIFRDPETETFETANAYLSGHVRRKLLAAKAAGLAKNVKALEEVQPARWGAENVAVQIGSTWVPPDVYAEFAEHLLGGKAKVSFSQLTNTFAVNTANVEATKADQWGTEDLTGAFILGKLLNSQTPMVMRTDSDGKTYVDKEATSLAMLKAREMVAEFGDWVFKDGGRRERLVEIFNEKFNTRVSRQYDGSHLKLPGKVPDAMIKMRRHQMNAIWRGISSRFLLIDHVVGAGKTFTAIARAMERRRMGLARKPTIVVPNHLVEQWQADVYRLYPAAKVLAATKKDFEKKNRRKLLSRVATGDYDIVILPHSSFGFVGISPETELRYLEEELTTALAAVKEAEEQAEEDGHQGFRKPVGVKEAERLVAKIEGRMARLREGARDRLLTFEQLGIDDLTIDEAHEFKNLFYSSRLTKVRGMGDKIGSRKAADLYNKVRVLRDSAGAVTFMTGTPVSNSVVELYTMMRYLASSELSDLGMEHFDAWRTQFVDASPAFEPNESGRLQEVTRLGRTWSNMRSLMDLYYGFTDAVTNDDIKKWYAEDNGGKEFPIPKVKGGERQLRKVAPTQAQEAVLKEVIAGFDGLDDIKDIKERNAARLRLMDRARKLSLDVRAANPASISDEKGGKLEQISDEVKRIYTQWDEDKGTQIIFLDRSVPKAKGDDVKIKEYDALIAKREKALAEDDDDAFGEANEALERFDSNEIQELRAAQSGGWNAYQQLKDNLIARGIPAAEIRFIQEANTDEQKQALFDAVNGGMVRVMIGSTPRMGAGTNVQQRLVAVHHADVTWKPSDIEQREGRIIRQGNQLLAKYGEGFEVEILAYATERTVDAKMWSLNATKLKAINGLRKYTGDFTMELEDEESVSMAEMAALASGNPLLLERVTLESEIQGLELQERAHRRKMYGAEDAVSNARRVIETYPGRIADTRQQAASLAGPIAELQKKAAARRVTVEGEEHDSYKDAMKAALAAVEKQQAGNDRARYVIDIAGQKVTSKEKIDEVIGAALGDDSEFEVEIEGKTFTQRTAAGRVASSILSPKAQNAVKTSMTGDLGRMLGMDLKFQMDPARYNEGKVDLVLWLERDGKTVVSGGIDSHDPFQAFTTASMRDALGNLLSEVEGKASVRGLDWMEQELERATQQLPELESRVGAPFPKAQEIKEKRARLEEVIRALTVEPPKTEEAEGEDEANYGEADTPFYSALSREIELLPTKSAPAVGWQMALQGLVKNGKVKADELEWTGITDWLKLQTGKVSKEDVISYLDANGVQVTETVLGGDGYYRDANGNRVFDDETGDYIGSKNPGTKYQNYTLPGGENYREVLLTLPVKSSADPARAEYEAWAQLNRLTPNATMTEQRYERETGRAAPPPRTMTAMESDRAKNYKSSHWDQPNVLAHIRVNDRTDADGKRVLFVEEIQSDWGQDGKKKGFAGEKVMPAGWSVVERQAGGWIVKDQNGDMQAWGDTREAAEQNAISANYELTAGVPRAPFIDKTDKWLALALKRVMKMAVDGGYDRVAFVNGEQSADRYDLSKQVDYIDYVKSAPNRWNVAVVPKVGDDIQRNALTAEQLEELVGKEVAQKIVNGEGQSGGGRKTLRGLDLKVGGEGMKAFYDRIVPAAVKDVLKKVGGGQMEMVGIDQTDERTAGPDEITWAQQPGFTITDAMREKVAGGLPLFAGSKAKQRGDASPVDRAVMDMAGEGRDANDILRLIADASKSPFNRQLARLLRRTGANPAVSLGGDMGGSDGFKNLAKYSRKNHEVTLSQGAADRAERIFLHETVHAATLMALDRGGQYADQMKALYESVKRQGGAAGQYGMKNVGEFVAEAFTNPEFQKALKGMRAPGATIWDRFVAAVRRILGLSDQSQDALSAALELGAEVMRENMPLRAAKSFRAEDAPAFAGVDQTETPEFKRWFGDSKVVDSAGKPLRVFHGTDKDFTEFDRETIGSAQWADEEGFFFTSDPEFANYFTGRSKVSLNEGANIKPVYLRIENPLTLEDVKHMNPRKMIDAKGVSNFYDSKRDQILNLAKKLGKDGIIFQDDQSREFADKNDHIVVFDPEQIKSATGNRGTFDPEDADIAHFGMADAAALKQSALDQIHQSLSHPGKVSVWDKTVGTMRNLAERSPAFKPVFEAAQRFIDDVSMLANEAADVAPRLLPRVESWRDLTKKPVSADDNKAIARPLFEGTLLWARDTDGKPVLVDDLAGKYVKTTADEKARLMMAAGRLDDRVLRMWQGLPEEQFETLVNSRFESQMLKPGVVWTDAELKSMFGMNEQQVSLYREGRAAIDRSIDLTARADMLRALGAEYAGMRDAVLEAPTLSDARDLLVDTMHADALDDEEKADRLMGLINTVSDRFEKAQQLIADGYAPLSRFGRYTVDVVDAAGERQYFGMFETMRDANQMAARLRGEFTGATVTQGTMSAEAYKLFAGITPESLELFGNMLGLDAEGGDARDKAFQEYLRLSKNNHSALKRLMHRKGIAGYSEDVGRVLASFVYSNARQAAGGLNAGIVEDAINRIPKEQGELKDVAMGLQAYVRDPQEEGQVVRGMLFAQYLGGSVASALVNMTQPFSVTMPWLSQHGGMKAAGQHLARAIKDMAGRQILAPDLQQALKHAEEDGIVSPQEIHQLMAQARGAGGLRSGDGTRAGDARAAASNAWERTKVAWGQPFALAEQFNRRSTFIAAYRLAQDRGMRAPAEFARRAVLETQFLYSKANKPRWARGVIGGTLFTFKTYSVSYLELLNRMWTQGGKEGKRAVGWSMAMLMLMGGAGGLPFMEDLEDLIDGIAQLMGYNVSAKQWRRQALEDVVGKEMAAFIDTGASGLPGAPIDVSGRLGMGDLIPGTGLLLTKQNRDRDLMEIAGPAGDLVARGFTGARKALTGDIGGAALELSPTAVRNAVKGVDMAITERYTDAKGYKVLDTTLPEAAAKAIGFQPRSVARVQEANSFMQRSKAFYTQTSADIKAQWARALFEKDEAALQRVRERLADWNSKNPDQRITVSMPDVWKRVREMGKDRTQRIADTAPKALRQEMREMARDAD